jgi:BirA family biotin operon repressor/biotin-[acetyl-CoA-carboxylase] ligase
MTPEFPTIAVMGNAGWRVQFHDHATSTNDLARTAAPWTAFVAASQSGGRGRFGREFVSDPGGLWLTATVPAPGPAAAWVGLSLAVGHHLLLMFERLGVPKVRLRWPNDLMVGDRKLAGLLIESGEPHTLCIGLGLNVSNRPWDRDPALGYTACRLADTLSPCPEAEAFVTPVLDAMADAHEDLASNGLGATITALNETWWRAGVTLSLYGGRTATGTFTGLDPSGNLLLADPSGSVQIIPHQDVEKLTEDHAPFLFQQPINT